MYSYDGLEALLQKKGIKRSQLVSLVGLSSRTVAKIGKGEKLSDECIQRLCAFFDCLPKDIVCRVCNNPILRVLQQEKDAKISGGLYHELQIRMTYNSNHIEGSKLSEEQTRLIFETNTLYVGDGVPVDDVLETVHHFRAIDYCIDHAEDVLTESIIKQLHYILKHDTKDSTLDWFAVGDYKKLPNVVGGNPTASPKEVPAKINALLREYNAKTAVTIYDIISFHASFEQIHPFQDGNGRVGRLIAFKECLRHNILPFIIEDSKKMFYYRGLSQWGKDNAYLTDTCLDGQDTFGRLLDLFQVPKR